MSKASRARDRRRPDARVREDSAAKPREPFPPRPFKPSRGLFLTISIVFAIWVAFLITMYFTTIRNNDNVGAPTPTPTTTTTTTPPPPPTTRESD